MNSPNDTTGQSRLARLALALLLGASAAGLQACDDTTDHNPDTTDGESDGESDGDITGESGDCDPLDTNTCALPWPSNLYLEEDSTTETGQRLVFGETSLPKSGGTQVTGDDWSRFDGYGVSTPIMMYFERPDVEGLASEANWAPSMEDDHPVHLLEVQDDGSVERIPHWIEMDRQADVGAESSRRPGETDESVQNRADAERVMWVRPAQILEEGTEYIVVVQGLTNEDGEEYPASAAFAQLRDNNVQDGSELAPRVDRFEDMFTKLDEAGYTRGDLTLAWDFVTASSSTIHGSALQMRDLALEAIGEDGPDMTVTETRQYRCTEEADDSGLSYNRGIAFEVEGTYNTPYYLKPVDENASSPLSIPSVLNLDEDGNVAQNGERDAPFWLMIPCTAVGSEAEPAGIIQYGHGLNGSGSQVFGGMNKIIANDYNYIFFAGDWLGMSEGDVGEIIGVLANLDNFAYVSDRVQQGMSEFITLGRAMQNDFLDLDVVTENEVQVDTSRYYYSGISQGGIYGATFTALSPDVQYGHLGVPGINYSVLLHRSVDFNFYFDIMRGAVPDVSNQSILMALIQTMWDQVDPSSYMKHLSEEPFPGNDPSYVMSIPAKGDHQVHTFTNLIAANSDIGMAVMENYGRDMANFGLTETPYVDGEEAYSGSAVILYDLGNPFQLSGNVPLDDTDFCFTQLGETDDCTEDSCLECDPHSIPRYFGDHHEQMIHFFENDGEVIDVCGGDGCKYENLDSVENGGDGCWGRDCNWVPSDEL